MCLREIHFEAMSSHQLINFVDYWKKQVSKAYYTYLFAYKLLNKCEKLF